jgi:DNA invertase Pin-like site-specific DNA recombinase
MINAVIYSRVSSESERQDTERQTSELIDYAHRMGYNINKVYEEKASGYKKNEDRPVFTKMLEDINANQIDKDLVWELSRIGRSVLQSLQNIQILHDMRVGIYIKNFNKVLR